MKGSANISLGDDINLILPISFNIDIDNIPHELQKNKILKFGLEEPNDNFLINYEQLLKFEKEISKIVKEINKNIGNSGKIHIFGTLPMPFCIALGQAIHRNNCECIFYDIDRNTGKWTGIISTKDIL